MVRLPVLSGKEVIKAFENLGWEVTRHKGSHVVLHKPGDVASLSVLQHREVAPGTLRSLIRNAGITVDDFVEGVKR